MSIPVKTTVRCPQCGKEIDFTMWQSINDEMPFALKDIITGKLFEAECKKCGKKANVHYPILVNDMAHRVMIYYIFPEDKEQTEKALEFMKNMYDGRVRIVTDQASLREKVAIFKEELDDRIIELLKLSILAQMQNQLGDKEVQGVYFVPDDHPRFEIVYEGGLYYVTFDMGFYDKIKDEFEQVEDFAKDTGPYIDLDWAYSIISADYEE